MPPRAEQVVQRLMDLNGISRGEAIDLLSDAYDEGDPRLRKIEDLPPLLRRERFFGPAAKALAGAASAAARPVASLFDLGARGTGLEQGFDINKYAAETLDPGQFSSGGLPKIPKAVPLVGGEDISTLAGEFAGGVAPFVGAESLIARPVEALAARTARVPAPLLRSLSEGTLKEGVEKAAFAKARARAAVATPALAG